MKLSTCITAHDGHIVVTELTDGNQYLPDDSKLTAKNRFHYEDTASIDILRLNSTGGNILTPAVITLRSNPEEVKIKLKRDGWFTAIHIVLPVQDWVYRELSKKNSIIYTYDTVYFTDGKEIFTCTKGKIEKSNLKNLLEELSDNTTISRNESDYVSIALLEKQLKESYLKLFHNRLYNGGCHTDACEANRLVAAINLVRHYVRFGQLAEAERMIEKVNHFESAISNRKDTKFYNDCGCK